VHLLKQAQKEDGSWEDATKQAPTGTTSLVTLALLTAGERPDSPAVRRALDFLRRFGPEQLLSISAIALQTMVFAAADPGSDLERIAANVSWLESTQFKRGDQAGSWNWTNTMPIQLGLNSNTQFALLGLDAAREAGVPVKDSVWSLARSYWVRAQHKDGGWGDSALDRLSAASMTCAGISSLVITGSKRFQGQEYLRDSVIVDCGKGGFSKKLQDGINWLGTNFSVVQNFPEGLQWKFHYIYGLERAGSLTGMRFFGQNDWYRLGAKELVRCQDVSGYWRGVSENPIVATSFALSFLSEGRAQVLVNKLRHAPRDDWNNDANDIRHLVSIVSRERKKLVTWQIIEPAVASLEDLLQAPIIFFNGHKAPEFDDLAKQNIRRYVDRGGVVFADSCCQSQEFDAGFRKLMKQVFPEKDCELRQLPANHPIWRAKHILTAGEYPLWGIQQGGRTVVLYSPKDLSCHWNVADGAGENRIADVAVRIGENVIEFATRGAEPIDRLSEPEGFHPLSDAEWTELIPDTPSK
jgi:hypothetical protein